MLTREQYIEYLVSTPINYTCTNLAAHLSGVSHDSITDFLKFQRLAASSLWETAKPLISDTDESYLILDDSVQEKPYAREIELVAAHYSGNTHSVVRGISLVNLVHSSADNDYYPIDFRIYALEHDGKTKNDHFIAMLKDAFHVRHVRAKYIVFDSWYASSENLKFIHREQRIFYTTIRSNRLVSRQKDGGYVHLDAITWTTAQLEQGIVLRIKSVPFDVRLFKIVAKNGNIDWLITNDMADTTTLDTVCDRYGIRWNVECLHRELKQLTGIEKCQCRHAWSQRNHITSCYHAWFALKARAQKLKMTLYAARNALFATYLRAELTHPRIPALRLTDYT